MAELQWRNQEVQMTIYYSVVGKGRPAVHLDGGQELAVCSLSRIRSTSAIVRFVTSS
jgi:hypothetical protein